MALKGGQIYRQILRNPNLEAGDDRPARATVSGDRKPCEALRGFAFLESGISAPGKLPHATADRSLEAVAPSADGGHLRNVVAEGTVRGRSPPRRSSTWPCSQPRSAAPGVGPQVVDGAEQRQPRRRSDRRPLRFMLAPLLQNQPNRTVPNRTGRPLWLLHDPFVSGIAAAGKPGALQVRIERMPLQSRSCKLSAS